MLQIDPNNTIALFELGFGLNNINQYPDAIDTYHKALKFDPNNVDGWLRLGIALSNNIQYSAAIEAFQKVLSSILRILALGIELELRLIIINNIQMRLMLIDERLKSPQKKQLFGVISRWC